MPSLEVEEEQLLTLPSPPAADVTQSCYPAPVTKRANLQRKVRLPYPDPPKTHSPSMLAMSYPSEQAAQGSG